MDSILHLRPELCFPEPPHPSLRVSIIVPAKDEAHLITSTLDALRNQIDAAGNGISHDIYEVLVLANNCSDATYEICKTYQQKFQGFRLYVQCINIEDSIAHIGTVRRLLMDAAHARLTEVVGKRGIIVSTDADSEVDAEWLSQIIEEMDLNVDVVGGRIIPRNTPVLAKIHHLRDVTYRFLKTRLEAELDPCPQNPWPRHFQCYGPSLAVTCEIYDKAGRIPAIPFLEDEEFRKALKRVDARMRHSPKVRVHTSSRLQGRVDFGFSIQLQEWGNMSLNHEEQMVESLDSASTKFNLKNELRHLWIAVKTGRHALLDTNLIAFKLRFDGEQLLSMINENTYFESLWEIVEQHLHQNHADLTLLVPISAAIAEFRTYFASKPTAVTNRMNAENIAIAV